MLGGERRGSALQRFPHRIELHQLLGVQVGQHHPVPGAVGEQSLGYDPMEGFAHRRSADVQPIGHIGFAQVLARPDLSRANGLAHDAIGEIAERLARFLSRMLAPERANGRAILGARGMVIGFGLRVQHPHVDAFFHKQTLDPVTADGSRAIMAATRFRRAAHA